VGSDVSIHRVSGVREFGGGRPGSWSHEVPSRDVIWAIDQRGRTAVGFDVSIHRVSGVREFGGGRPNPWSREVPNSEK
jgi:hypothetical protein